MTDGVGNPSAFQGKYDEAELLYRRAMTIMESTLGGKHPSYSIGLNNLAGLLSEQVRFINDALLAG